MEREKFTKADIEKLANEVMDWLVENELFMDVSIYFNNKRIRKKNIYDKDWNFVETKTIVEEDMNPLDYFEYVNPHHILSMTFEGSLYQELNEFGETHEELQGIFYKYNMYFELGNAWNLSVYVETNSDDWVEYTDYSDKVEPDPIDIFNANEEDIPMELRLIAKVWWDLSSREKDEGSCVIGAGFTFDYKEQRYKLHSQSRWQGSITWEKHTDIIQKQLEFIGATNITYDWGRMD